MVCDCMVIFVAECPPHADPCVQYSLGYTQPSCFSRYHGEASRAVLAPARPGVRALAMSKYVDEPDVDQVMGRRVQNTDDEDSDSGDELDFSKQRQQLKQRQQQQQQPTPTRTSTVALLPGLLAVENGEDGEEERSDQTHVTQHHTAALCEACQAGDVEALRRLLALPGTQVGAANAEGESPLHVAARAGHAACVRQLAATSADLNLQSAQQDGATPLLLAVRAGAHGLETLKALLEAGADPNGGGGGRGGGADGGGGGGGGGAAPLLVAACHGPSSAVRVPP